MRSSENALRLAQFLEGQPKVEWVRYPGLPSHPDHEVAGRLIDGPGGGMLTFRMHGGIPAMTAFTDNLQLCDVGVSLGDVFTLVYPQPKRDGLVRVSVGCEDVADLLEDFTRGLSFVA
jgi:cystathionine beta-lyase/cystathionine gamma-synthase